jgi:hypothetical protein
MSLCIILLIMSEERTENKDIKKLILADDILIQG